MKTARLLAALLITGFLPAFAHAQNTYYPYYSGGLVSRAEFVRMVLNEVGGYTMDGTNCFIDVTNQPYAQSVCAAKQRGIVTGKSDGRFSPDMPIAFVEAAAVVVRAKGEYVAGGPIWYSPYIQKLSDWGAIPESLHNIMDPLTVDQAQELIDQAIDADDDDDGDDNDDEDDANDEMKVTVTASDSTVEEGDRVTFRIKIQNKDNDDIEVDVNAELDDAMDFVSADNGGDDSDTGSGDDDEVEWNDIEIDEDDTETLLLTVELNSRADDGDTLRIRVEVEDITVTKTIRVDDDDDDDDEDLELSVSDSMDPVQESGTVTYRIKLVNNSNDDMNVDVLAELDDAMNFLSASDGGDEDRDEVEWKDIRLDEDETKTILLTVKLNSRADDGDTLRLNVEANEEEDVETTKVDDDDNDDNDDEENVSISITDSDDPAEINDYVTYRIRIQNNENDDITIDVTATLDEAMRYLSATSGGEEDGDDEVVWEDITIKEDAEKVLTLDVRITTEADDGDTLRLKVEAGDDTDIETTKVED